MPRRAARASFRPDPRCAWGAPIPDPARRTALTAAVLAAGVLIAFQTAGKATRDALFLSSFSPRALPTMVVAAAATSVGLAYLASRLLARADPARLMPGAFAASAALLLLEWALLVPARAAVSVALYLHFAGLGAVLLSGFWSVVNERFDPHTAKRFVARIATGGTVGGVFGGALAAQVAGAASVDAMLPVLAALHLGGAGLVGAVRRGARAEAAGPAADEGPLAGLRVIRRTPYLRALLAVVLLTTVGEGLLDYAFKARAHAAAGGGEALLRLFAWFYTAVADSAVLLQAAAARSALRRLGAGRTLGALPLAVAAGGVGALALPGLPSILLLRGGESVVRSGLYRAGYELSFAPLPAREKRATKALLDVGAVRSGDVLGAALVQLSLLAAPEPTALLVGGAVALSLCAAAVAFRLQPGYQAALERSLLSRARQLDVAEAEDLATRTALLHTAGVLRTALGERPSGLLPDEPSAGSGPSPPPGAGAAAGTAAPPGLDPDVARAAELRSRDADRVRAALRGGPLSRALVPWAVPLLAWDAVAAEAGAALRRAAPHSAGQLLDHLLDPDEEFAVRRRLPLALADCPSQRAVDGLVAALGDARFEVRYRAGRVLSRLTELDPALRVDRDAICAAVLREAAVDREVWESRRLLDAASDDEAWSPVVDELVRDRADRSLEHVFTVLALVLPRQPLRVAFRGLHTGDQMLRGTALEYLEGVLPPEVRSALWPFLRAPRAGGRPARPSDAVLEELLASDASIGRKLEALRRGSKG